MTRVGNMVIGPKAELLRLDAGFCDIMRAPAETMLGRQILDLTAPPDRPACRAAMANLRATGQAYRVDKRLLRPDGSTLWVTKTVSIADFADGDPHILGVVVPIDEAEETIARDPGAALIEAKRQAAALVHRATTFGPTLFADPGWAMLLAAYILEAEGEVPTLAAMADTACAVRGVTTRWAKALVAEGLLAVVDAEGYRLTGQGRALFDHYLGRNPLPAARH